MPPDRTVPALRRSLGTGDAVVIGLGSMLGAGVFAVWAPAAGVAGSWLLLGLALAGAVAYANATASAQLAAASPVAGGTYVYGRQRLGPWWGFAAGWAFVIGKTASCAAMALTFGAYVVPDGPRWAERAVGVAAVVAMAALDYRGVDRTVRAARALVAGTLLALAVVVGAGVAGTVEAGGAADLGAGPDVSAYDVLQAAGLLFFAFAGYARIATLGEEVRDPARTIPRAVPVALGIVMVTYAVVGAVALVAVGPAELAAATAPLAVVTGTSAPALEPVVRVGAALASLGALLALLAGIGRTTLAMARESDLPPALAAVHPRWRTPHRAEVAVAAAVALLVLTVDLRGALGFSSFGVLLYYAIANASATRQPPAERRWPRWLHVAGVGGCLLLAVSLPPAAALAGGAVLAVGLLGRWIRLARAARHVTRDATPDATPDAIGEADRAADRDR